MTQHVNLGGASTGPLSGVRIIDFTAVYSGPIAAGMLADQGAEVIKVEAPSGDMMRRGLPQSNGVGSSFATMNRNKKAVCLNLAEPAAVEVARKLVASADVVMENFRPGVMDRLGLGYDSFREDHPKLIYVSISGVGTSGPYANRRVYDAVIQAIAGFCTLAAPNDEDGAPAMVNTLICDKVTSLTAAQAVTSALFSAERSGQGQRVELSMLDANLYFLWPDGMINSTLMGDDIEQMSYIDHSLFCRKTKDGWVAAMPVQQGEVQGAFRALEIEDLFGDERFATYQARARNRELMRELMDEAYQKFTTDEICERFEAEDVPYSRINRRADVADDPQIQAMEALWTYDHPRAGPVRSPRPPAQFERTPSNIRAHTPGLGEHNAEVLSELGISSEEIAELLAQGALVAE